ncbi:MAG: SagB/ThcOx family dehydrogenase [bacterium]|nr:SagB/ThcOx family dehydrogenase [bacterium]
MADPFFNYFREERNSISRNVYEGTQGSFSCKEYPRFPQIFLPPPIKLEHSLSGILEKRKSTRSFIAEPLSLLEISSLLFWSMGMLNSHTQGETKHRMHPSGGAKFPIECYPLIIKKGELTRGIYHYNSFKHVLEKIASEEILNNDVLWSSFAYPFVRDAAVVLVFSFVKERSIQKYGGLAYKLGLLEAGHIGQNVYLVSTALNLGCCALGFGLQEVKSLHSLFDLDGSNESLCYAIAIGRPVQK